MKHPVTRFFLVRHGETAANRDLRYIGSRDDLLTEQGQRQAQQLAEVLSMLPVHAIYASPRRRARDTAQLLADRIRLPVLVTDELRENAFGAWEGMSRAEVLAHSPAYADLLQAWEADASIEPPGGESIAVMSTRVSAFAQRLTTEHPDQNIVLVSHVGPIKALISATLSQNDAIVRRMFLDPATISVIDWAGEKRVLRLFNSHAHLGWTAARWM